MVGRETPEIRIGFIRFTGREALRSQRWAITCLLVAQSAVKIGLLLLVFTAVLKPELLNVVYRSDDRIECSGLLCPLLKLPLLGRLVRAGPLHFEKVRLAGVYKNDVGNAFQ